MSLINKHTKNVALFAILVASTVLVACGGSSGPVSITVWSWVPNLQDEAKLYMQSHSNVKITVVNAGQGAAQYTKLQTALKAGSGAPDVAQIEFPYLPEFELTGKLVDLTKYGANDIKDQFVPWTWNQVSSGAKVYAIPQDSGPMGLLYRTDLLAQYGLTVPTTWDQFTTEATMLHQANSKTYLTEFSTNDPNWFFSLLWQAGSHPFTVNGTNVSLHLDDAAALKVANYWGNLIKSGTIQAAPDFNNDWYTGLSNGTYASWVTAAWGPVFLKSVAQSTSGKWMVAEIPQWTAGAHANSNWGGSTDAVTTYSQHPKEATDFITWLNSSSTSVTKLNTEQSLFPTVSSVLNDPTFSAATDNFFSNQPINKLFGQYSQTVDTSFQWSPFTDYVYQTWQTDFGQAINGSTSYEGAMHKLQSDVVSYAKAQGFTVTQ
jgi:multiple sugar transport system substrate-binding protein